jgi:dTDP-4-amino-4,6-dideoxygalactose transaminase
MIGRTRVPFARPARRPDIETALRSELETQFGNEFKCMLFPSGRSALYFGLRHCAATHVVLPAFTCKAVLEAALFAGKKPVFADVNPETFCIGAETLKSIPLNGNYAILCTHQYGFPAPLDEIADLCRRTGAMLLEDCAASLGTTYRGRPTGTLGYFSVFSGDVFKMAPVASGIGMLLSKDQELMSRIRNDRAYGSARRSGPEKIKCLMTKMFLRAINRPVMYGLFYFFRFRFSAKKTNDSPVPAPAVSKPYFLEVERSGKEEFYAQLSRLRTHLEKRRALARYYFDNLIGLKGVRVPELFSDLNGTLGLIRFPIVVTGIGKTEFYRRCIRRGIDLGFVFSFPLAGSEPTCPNARKLSATVLNLPFYPGLTGSEAQAVVAAIRRIDAEM